MDIQKPLLRLCLKAICLYERLSQKSYQSIDLEEAQERLHLLYAMYMAEPSNKPLDLDTFALMLESQDIATRLVKEASLALQSEALLGKISTQALSPQEPPRQDEAQTDTTTQAPALLSPLVARLIIEGGLGAHYVMYQMNLWELPLHLEALQAQQQERMERERLWAYLGLSPYLDPSKVKSPRDLLPLPHELKAIEAEQQAHEADLALLFGLQCNSPGQG